MVDVKTVMSSCEEPAENGSDWCHRQETTKLQKRLAEQRRVAKGNVDTQPETNCNSVPDSEEKKQ